MGEKDEKRLDEGMKGRRSGETLLPLREKSESVMDNHSICLKFWCLIIHLVPSAGGTTCCLITVQ